MQMHMNPERYTLLHTSKNRYTQMHNYKHLRTDTGKQKHYINTHEHTNAPTNTYKIHINTY